VAEFVGPLDSHASGTPRYASEAMITRVDQKLRTEARRYALRFGCEACRAFDHEREACAYGYPTEPHRESVIDREEQLAFCKAFELE